MSNKPLTIRIPQKLRTRFEDHARWTNKTKTQVIIEALNLYLESDEAKKDIKIDSKAIGEIWLLLYRQLDFDLNIGLVPDQLMNLTNKIKNADYDIKIRVFNQTHVFFKECLKCIKNSPQQERSEKAKLLNRAIPIFDSLIKNNNDSQKFHRVYAYLAYALAYIDTYVKKEDINIKDLYSQSPLELISKAIQIRTDNEPNPEFYIYELKRTIFKIKDNYQINQQNETSKDFLNELIEDLEKSIENCKLAKEICQCILEEDDKKFKKDIENIIVGSDFTFKECKKIRDFKEIKEWMKKYFQV